MAENYSIDAEIRTIKGKEVRHLRKQDRIPAVVYGAGGENLHISLPRRPLEIVLAKAGGTHLITVSVNGEPVNTLVREVQRDVIRRNIMHVDFLRVDMSKKIVTHVHLTLVNPAKLATEFALEQNLTGIDVESLPGNIPDHIEVDVSGLTELGATLIVGDLPAIPDVEYVSDPTEVICRVALAEIAEMAEEETEVVAEPELVERGKKDEDEDEDK